MQYICDVKSRFMQKIPQKLKGDTIMSEFINTVREVANGSLNGVSDAVILALIFVEDF